MNPGYLRRIVTRHSSDVVELLTTRQHLRPHQPLSEVLQAAMDELGCCPRAIERAVGWLQIDARKPVGRLRRGELIQLGKSIHRFWRGSSTDQTVEQSAK